MNPFKTVSCASAAAEIRKVLGPATLGPNVASMLRDLDKCNNVSCPGHNHLEVILGATERERLDVAEIAILALIN